MIICVETVLFFTQLPVFSVFEQKNDPVIVECNTLDIWVHLHLHHLLSVVKQIANQQISSTLDSDNSRTIDIYSLSVEFHLLSRWTDAIQVPLQHVTLSSAHIEQTLILIETNGSRGIWVSKDFDFSTFIHVDHSGLAVLAGEANILLLESKYVLNGREILYLFNQRCLEVVPDGHLTVFQRHHQEAFSEKTQRTYGLAVDAQFLLSGDCIAVGDLVQSNIFLGSSHCHDALICAELYSIDSSLLSSAHHYLYSREIVYHQLVCSRTGSYKPALLTESQLNHLWRMYLYCPWLTFRLYLPYSQRTIRTTRIQLACSIKLQTFNWSIVAVDLFDEFIFASVPKINLSVLVRSGKSAFIWVIS